jgi:hypothetical protein
MIEADSQLKLLLASILDILKVCEHIDMLSMGIWQSPETVILTLLGSYFGVLDHLWSQNQLSPYIVDIYKVFEHIDMLSMGIAEVSNSYTHTTWLRVWDSGSLVESK